MVVEPSFAVPHPASPGSLPRLTGCCVHAELIKSPCLRYYSNRGKNDAVVVQFLAISPKEFGRTRADGRGNSRPGIVLQGLLVEVREVEMAISN